MTQTSTNRTQARLANTLENNQSQANTMRHSHDSATATACGSETIESSEIATACGSEPKVTNPKVSNAEVGSLVTTSCGNETVSDNEIASACGSEKSKSTTPPITQKEWQMWRDTAYITSSTLAQVDMQIHREFSLSLSDFDVLATLRRHEGGKASMACLTSTVIVTTSGLSRSISRLESAGYVTKQQSSKDKRAVTVCITQQGRDILHTMGEVNDAIVYERFMQPLSSEEKQSLATIMRKLVQQVRE